MGPDLSRVASRMDDALDALDGAGALRLYLMATPTGAAVSGEVAARPQDWLEVFGYGEAALRWDGRASWELGAGLRIGF